MAAPAARSGSGPWYWWKRATSWFMSTSIVLVSQAMDRRTRASTPWRYHVWFYAWLIAIVAYVPVGGVVAVIVGFGPESAWKDVVLYGPLALMSCFFLYYMVRHYLCRVPVPPDPPVRARRSRKGQGRKARDEEGRGTGRWYWLGPTLVTIYLVGRLIIDRR